MVKLLELREYDRLLVIVAGHYQLPLDTLASLCKLIAKWLSGPVVVCANFTCEFLTSYAVDVMYNTVLAEPL